MGGKDDEARRPGGQELSPAQGEWQDGESARAPVTSGAVKACGRRPGKFRHTGPGTDDSAASQKDAAVRARADSYCFLLLPWRVGAREMWGRDAACRG